MAPCLGTGPLREYVPLKQGLRLQEDQQIKPKTVLREYVPLKQGLRLSFS